MRELDFIKLNTVIAFYRLSPLSSLSGLSKEKPGAPPIESLYSNTTPRVDELKNEQKFYTPAPANKVTMFGAHNTPGELTKTPGKILTLVYSFLHS